MSSDPSNLAARGMRLLLRTPICLDAIALPGTVMTAKARDIDASTKASDIPALCVRIPEAARMLGIGRTKTYELINAGELDTIKLGQVVVVTIKSLEAFVVRHANTRSEAR
jgi:excisionase family DNA binding protein